MPRYQHLLFKASRAIYQELLRFGAGAPVPPLPADTWQRVTHLQRQIAAARACGWSAAARRKTREFRDAVEEHQQVTSRHLASLEAALVPPRLSRPAEIYRDLVALQQEPLELTADRAEAQLCVRTEPIELDAIPLGRFEIRLDWREIHRPYEAYRIVALQPNPAAADDSVTHPHVRAERLCEGEGRTAIRRALTEGRFFDFFTIVDRLLHTYARGQAYVELERWSGVRCADCSSIVDDGEGSNCDRCEEWICCDCTNSCPHCGQICCANCLERCPQCEELTCRGCLERCSRCQACVCPDCVSDQLCRECHATESISENQPDQPADPLAPAADTAIYADRVGQAALFAGSGAD
jgi:hypothetical protein